ncbi:hypothetical protein AMES_3685 [Amycolatopsis mediterranei S699]|uniref:Cyclophilin-like domain-containing protein n=2 Tax=Amycolatopsis mediterranei TaxID=33910 RepID=A0A0H3D5X8_AMYMU|nr:cyclophilin-like fold protein [Amycolatopsis mediterranei]ADJ45508.1 conserved hypothetical protein [Amycolatopsis mediterranei U32]AEK42282.1 hypothetical protein RAM_18980 [Amycolatopsis mediterranei S699]AFO77221.1 hypothetical protein AMES_3685 [Amycolatopsis mediterranei S699]AGT84349.1 hypothetical protein B737_3685 [Amycolatopsis mediterranei RB]KDO06088.1 hypothetical protein DV26_35985 [Amycolatopsis mediterranei]
MNIRLTVDGRVVTATLNDSPSARDFATLLPLTLNLSDFHETERISDLPRRLTTSGAPESAEPKAGDIAFYAPWGNLAIYYRDAPPASGVVVLGRLADGVCRRARRCRAGRRRTRPLILETPACRSGEKWAVQENRLCTHPEVT